MPRRPRAAALLARRRIAQLARVRLADADECALVEEVARALERALDEYTRASDRRWQQYIGTLLLDRAHVHSVAEAK